MSASRVSPMWLPGRQKQYFGFHFGKSNSSKVKGFLTNMIKILRKWRSEWGSLAAKIAPRDAKCLFATVGNFCESCINGPLFSSFEFHFAFWLRQLRKQLSSFFGAQFIIMVFVFSFQEKGFFTTVIQSSFQALFCREFQIEYRKNLCWTDGVIFANLPRVLQSHKRPTTYVRSVMQISTTLQTSVTRPYNINTLSRKKGR